MNPPRLPGTVRAAALVGAVAALTLLSGWPLAAAAGSLTAAGVIFEPAVRRLLGRIRFWLLMISPLLIGLVLFGRLQPPRFALTGEELRLTAEMSLRALALIMAVQLALAGITVSRLMRWFDQRGLRGLGFAFGVAHNMLDTLGDTLSGAFVAMRLRGGFRRRPWRSLGLFLVTVVATTLAHADQVVHAACARAFDPAAVKRGRGRAGLPAGRRLFRRPDFED